MSRWSADVLRVALAPGEIALVRGTRRASLPAGRAAAALLPVLDEALADTAWRARRVEVVLSQHFVRHVLTPPPGKTLPPAEETMLVRASLRDIYGELVQDWAVRVYSQPPHAGLVGAAIDGAFTRELDALLTRRGFRKIAIRPLASVAVGSAPKIVNGWWVLVEPGWLSFFGSAKGCWQHIAGLPVDDAWHEALPGLLARERGSALMPIPPTVWLQTLGMGTVAAPRDSEVRWQLLPGTERSNGVQAFLDF